MNALISLIQSRLGPKASGFIASALAALGLFVSEEQVSTALGQLSGALSGEDAVRAVVILLIGWFTFLTRKTPTHDIPAVPVDPTETVETSIVQPKRLPKNYFSQAELECKGQKCNCEFPGISDTTLRIGNEAREEFGPMVANSAFRCQQHNSDVGGSDGSYHVTGRALDLRPVNADVRDVYAWLDAKYPRQYGFGLYENKSFIHIDDRGPGVYARKASSSDVWRESDRLDVELY